MSNYLRSALNYLGAADDGGPPPSRSSAQYQRDDSGMVGKVVTVADSRYRVVKQIAEGGFAYVFLVQETTSGQSYALKRLIVPDKERLTLAQQEIEVMQLGNRHPAIVKLVSTQTLSSRETGHNNAEVLIVMELCPGSLIHIMNERMKGFDVHDVVRIFEPIVSAVAFLHSQSPPIIHRDLKVENVLVSSSRDVRLCDFGSATRKVMAPQSQAEIGQAEDEIQLNTTPQYRAPEMWDLYSRIPVDAKSDVWALGCMLYKLCYYRTPYDDGSKMAICNADLRLPANPGPHVVFHELLKRTLQKDPKERLSAAQVLSEVQAIGKQVGPRANGGGDVLYVELPEVDTNGGSMVGAGPSAGVQGKLMGAIRNVKSMVDQQLAPVPPQANAPQRHRAQSQHRQQQEVQQQQPDMECSYITPRIIGMKVPSTQALDQMRSFLDSKHRDNYFVWNLSDADYPTHQFGDRVRHVSHPKKGTLELDALYEVCEGIEAWLVSDREHVAVVHCTNGTTRTGPVIAAYTVFTGLFSSARDGLRHFAAKRRDVPTWRASAVRQLDHLANVAQGTAPGAKQAQVASVAFPALAVFARQPQPPFVAVQQHGHTVFSSRDRPPADQGGQLVMRCGQAVDGDFMIILASPQTDKTAVPVCQLQDHSFFTEAGVRRYGVGDLDKPVKSLGQDFYVEVTFEASDDQSGAPQPWRAGAPRRQNPLASCFFTDQEGRELTRAYERELGIRSERTARASAPEGSPSRSRGEPRESRTSQKETPAVNSLIDFGSEPSVEAEMATMDIGKQSTPPPVSQEADLLGFDVHEPAAVPSSSTAPVAHPDPFGLMSDPHAHAGDLFALHPFPAAASPMHKSASGSLLDGEPSRALPRSPSTNSFTPKMGSPRPAPQPSPKPFDPFDQLVGAPTATPAAPTATSSAPQRTRPAPAPSSASQSSLGQPNYRVSTAAYMSPTTLSPRPQKHDPFGGLDGLSKSTSPQPPSSSAGANRSPGPMGAGGARPAMATQAPQWQQQQRAAQQRQAQEQLQRAAQQRQNQALEQQKRRQQDAEKSRWAKTTQGTAGGFDDLLAEHKFAPTTRDKGPVSMNAIRKEEMLSNDTDGSVALRLKVQGWTDGKKGNIRALLSTLHDVIWDESGWDPVSISELLKAVQVKKTFMRACLIVHPDKVSGDEHEPLARLIFDELNKAYNAFKEAGMPSLG